MTLGNGAVVTLTGGFTIRANHFFKILAEVMLPAAISSQSGFQTANGALVSYGVRFYGRTVAADLSFIRPFGGNGDFTEFPLGLPFVTFNARF